MVMREYYEWSNYWWVQAGDFKVKRIALVGDSITNSYYDGVNSALSTDSLKVDRFATSHCAGDPAFLAELEFIFGPANGYRYELIHFNNGLHGGCNDTMLSLDYYEKGMRDAIALIRRLQGQAKLVLVTSTNMVRRGEPEDKFDAAFNGFILERNSLIRRLGEEMNLPVDDLYETVAWKAQYPHSDGVHFAPDGVKALAAQVASFIGERLEKQN